MNEKFSHFNSLGFTQVRLSHAYRLFVLTPLYEANEHPIQKVLARYSAACWQEDAAQSLTTIRSWGATHGCAKATAASWRCCAGCANTATTGASSPTKWNVWRDPPSPRPTAIASETAAQIGGADYLVQTVDELWPVLRDR